VIWQALTLVALLAVLALDILAMRTTRRRCEAMSQRLDVQRDRIDWQSAAIADLERRLRERAN